jgi:hypothetical protein
MNDEKKPVGSNSKRFDTMRLRLLDLLPRNYWVEDAESVLIHVLANQPSEDDKSL